MADYFVYCMKCKRRVSDPSKPCPGCNSAEDMVDWVEPEKDCEKLSTDEEGWNPQDCLERGDPNPCQACVEWEAWSLAKDGEAWP